MRRTPEEPIAYVALPFAILISAGMRLVILPFVLTGRLIAWAWPGAWNFAFGWPDEPPAPNAEARDSRSS